MRYTNPRPEFRGSRTFVANLLAFVLLASQLAPLASAQGARGGARRQQPEKVKSEQPGRGEGNSGGEKASPVTAAPLGAPAITATKVDAFPDPNADGKADPGETITYTVTVTNTGGDPATGVVFNDTVDANTTLVPGSTNTSPIVGADAYNVVGNVRIQPNAAQGLLVNDRDPDTGTSTGLTVTSLAGDNTAPFAGTSAQGGQVTSSTTDGAFTYNPAPGYAGADTFSYTVSDAGPDDIAGNADDTTDTATVTLQVGNGTATPGTNVIWFVDDSAAAGGDGRLTSPFNCYTGTNVPAVSTCFSNSTADEAGDSIFLFVGAYTGGHTLLDAQKLVGQGATDTLELIAGVTPPAYSDPLPQTNEPTGTNPTPPTITTAAAANGVNLAQNNVLRGFTVGNVPAANVKINGAGFGQLTVGKATEPDVVLSGTGRALQLVNGTLAATSGLGSVGTTSGSGAASILLSQITAGALTFASTTVSGATAGGVEVNGSSADINFGNTDITPGTVGVLLANNPAGTRTFGTLTISGGSGIGFQHSDPDGAGTAVGGGAVNVTGAMNVINPAGNGIDIQNSNANLSFAATTVSKGSTSNIGVNLVNNATRTISFTQLGSTTTNAFALLANNSGTVNTGAGSLTQNGAGGGAASLTNTALGLTFNTVSSTSGGNGLIFSGGSGTFTTGSTNLQSNAGVGLLMSSSSVAASFGNTIVNSSAGDAVDLSNQTGNVTFGDLDLTPDAGLRGLDASGSTGTITSTSGDIAATNAPAINIVGPAGRTPLNMVLTNVDSTNSTTQGVLLNLVSGNLTVNDPGTATNIQNSTGNGVELTNSGAGAINFGNTTVNASGNANGDDAGTGIVLTTNAAAVTFGALTVTPDSGERGLLANDGDDAAAGLITVGSGTVTTTNDTAVEINGRSNAIRTPLNVQLTTVNTTGGGVAPNGIVLLNTSASGSPGGFRVLGNGGTCNEATPTCTGGHIQSTTGADVDPVLSTPAGTGIVLRNANSVSFTRIRINGNTNYGIHGLNVSGFTLADSVVHGVNGSNVASPFRDSSIRFDQLSGTTSITNSLITGGHQHNLLIDNQSGTAQITVSGNTIKNTSAAAGDDGFQLEAELTAVVNAFVTNNAFSAHGGDHFNLSMINTADVDLTFTGNSFAGGHAIGLSQGLFILGATFNGSFTYDISNNGTAAAPLVGNRQVGMIHVNKGSGTATYNGRINNNFIGNAAVTNSGSLEAFGIIVGARGSGGTHNTLITNNSVRQYEDRGIVLEAGEGSAALNATVTNNTVDNFADAVNSLHGIHSDNGILSTDTNAVCMDIQDNLVATAGNEPQGGADIRLRKGTQVGLSVRIPGLVGTTATDADNKITAENPLATTVTVSGAGFTGGAACTQPSLPAAPAAPISIGSAADVSNDTPASQPQQFILPLVSQPQPAAQVGAQRDTQPAFVAASAKPEKAATDKSGDKTASLDKADKADKRAAVIAAAPLVVAPNTVSVQIGTLNPGDSVTITFQVTVNNPFPAGTTQVSNQGTVSGTNFSNVLTDDPSVVGTSNPTVTPVQGPPDINVRDASTNEPATGSNTMAFTVTLSAPSTNTVTVNFATADEPAGPGKAVAGTDYTATSGTLTFAAGQTVQTVSVPVLSDGTAGEPDETFLVNLSTPVNGNIVDGQAVGTITAANPAGTTLISELRTSGPGTLGTGDPNDEFVEVYNNTDANVTVAASDASAGWGLYKTGAACTDTPVLIGTIPNGTVIPARGHYLFVGTGYSLANYGGTGAAAGNQTLTSGIEDDRNVGLFNTSTAANLATGTRKDAVGFGTNTGNNCDLLREGATLAAAQGSITEHTFVRNQTTGVPLDRNDNAGDFFVLSTTPGTAVGATATPRLGAPGPENLASPINRSSSIKASLADPLGSPTGPQNRVRNTTPDPANNSTFGTLAIRRKFTNTTGGTVTRLRFRVIDITTTPVPAGTADLRVRTSSTSTISLTGGGTTQVQGLTLETPPAQPNGGGWNSTVAAGTITTGTPLAAGASINVEFLLGLQQTGTFRFFIIVEAVPGGPPFGPEKLGPADAKGGLGRDDSKDTPQN